MATFQANGYITRTSLGQGNLVIDEAGGYYIQRDGFGPGEVSHRRSYVESPYMNGGYLTHSVKDQMHSTLKIRVQGSNSPDLVNKMEAICTAFEQFSYTLSVTINGQAYTYSCDAADYTIGDGGNLQDLWLRSNTQIVTFDVPHLPPDQGVLP